MGSKHTLIVFELFTDDEGFYFAGKAYKDEAANDFIDSCIQKPPTGILKVFHNISDFDDWLIGFGPKQSFREENWLYAQYKTSYDRKKRKDSYRRERQRAII